MTQREWKLKDAFRTLCNNECKLNSSATLLQSFSRFEDQGFLSEIIFEVLSPFEKISNSYFNDLLLIDCIFETLLI